MKEFYSLREYLLLRHPEYKDGSRSLHRNEEMHSNSRKGKSSAEDMIERYDIAKKSWEKYGDNPPFGRIVQTLYSGHGGGPGIVKILDGIYRRDPRYFQLVLPADTKHYFGSGTSIVLREIWWNEIQILE